MSQMSVGAKAENEQQFYYSINCSLKIPIFRLIYFPVFLKCCYCMENKNMAITHHCQRNPYSNVFYHHRKQLLIFVYMKPSSYFWSTLTMLHILIWSLSSTTLLIYFPCMIIIYSLPHVENVDSYGIKSNKTGQISDKNVTIS